MSPRRAPSILGAAVAAAFALGGCSVSSSKIHVTSTSATNGGNTLYMMVRDAEGKTTVAERYQEVAAKLFTDPPDPSVITSQPLFPGSPVTTTLPSNDKDVIIYFFFTEPGANWRVPLRKPLPAEVYIELGAHQVERVQVRRR